MLRFQTSNLFSRQTFFRGVPRALVNRCKWCHNYVTLKTQTLKLSPTSFFFSLPLFCQCFWTDWQNVFSNFCPIAALSVCGQDRSQQYDMPCAFNLCLLQISSNGRLKQEHLEFSSSATKNIISPLPQCRWLPNSAEWWLTKKGYHQLNYMTLWSGGFARSRDKLNSL